MTPFPTLSQWTRRTALCLLLAIGSAQAGGEDTVAYVDVLSGTVLKPLPSKPVYGTIELSRYWPSQELKHEYEALGIGVGAEISRSNNYAIVLAKYSYLGLMGVEAGPKFNTEDGGLKVRAWAGLFLLGLQGEYSYSGGDGSRVGAGIYGALPLGEKRNGKYSTIAHYILDLF